jgi:hypothetical protein
MNKKQEEQRMKYLESLAEKVKDLSLKIKR